MKIVKNLQKNCQPPAPVVYYHISAPISKNEREDEKIGDSFIFSGDVR